MDQSLILETTFLIDLERERNGRSQDRFKRCSVFLKRHATYRLFMTDIIAGELASGVCPHDRAKWEEFINPFRILPMCPRVSWEYGETYRYLKANSMLIRQQRPVDRRRRSCLRGAGGYSQRRAFPAHTTVAGDLVLIPGYHSCAGAVTGGIAGLSRLPQAHGRSAQYHTGGPGKRRWQRRPRGPKCGSLLPRNQVSAWRHAGTACRRRSSARRAGSRPPGC